VHAAVTARSLIEAVLVPDHSAGAATVDASKGRANAVQTKVEQVALAHFIGILPIQVAGEAAATEEDHAVVEAGEQAGTPLQERVTGKWVCEHISACADQTGYLCQLGPRAFPSPQARCLR